MAVCNKLHDSLLRPVMFQFVLAFGPSGVGGTDQSWKSIPRAWKTTSRLLIETRHNELILRLVGPSWFGFVFLSYSFRLGIFLPFSGMKQKMGVYFDELPEYNVIPRGFQNDKISHFIFISCILFTSCKRNVKEKGRPESDCTKYSCSTW
jgi:hypothetical protein